MQYFDYSTADGSSFQRTVSLQDFLQTIVISGRDQQVPNTPKQEMIRQLFAQALELTERIRASQPRIPGIIYTEPPELLVNIDPALGAECVFTAIKVSSGLIEASLRTPYPDLNNTIGSHSREDIHATNLPNMLFCWTVAHEYSHIVRRHDEISQVVGHDALTQQAFEYDADLCAIAAVFRWYQALIGPGIDDNILRQIIFSHLFWAIRALPNPESSRSHLSTAQRLYHLSTKLAQLEAKPRGLNTLAEIRNYGNVVTDEQLARAGILADCLARCEAEYLKTMPIGKDDSAKDILREILHYIESSGFSPMLQKWEEILVKVVLAS